MTFTSQGNNELFDVKFKTPEVETKSIRIMKYTKIDVRNIFLNKIKQAGSPVTVIKLSPTPKGIFFYNSSRGSKFVVFLAPNVNFNVDSNVIMSIRNIKSKNTRSFDIRGAINWLFPAEEVDSPGQ